MGRSPAKTVDIIWNKKKKLNSNNEIGIKSAGVTFYLKYKRQKAQIKNSELKGLITA